MVISVFIDLKVAKKRKAIKGSYQLYLTKKLKMNKSKLKGLKNSEI